MHEQRVEYAVAYNPDDDCVYYRLAANGVLQDGGKFDWWTAWGMFTYTYSVMAGAVDVRAKMHNRDTAEAVKMAQSILMKNELIDEGISPWVQL